MKIDSLLTLQKFTNVSNEFSYETLTSYETASFTKYLEQWFNADLLEQVFGYEAELPATEEYKAYEALMFAHVAFTMLEYSQQGEVIVSDLGFVRTENENTKSAYAQQMKMYRTSQEDNGFMYVNKLIDILDTYGGTFPEWANSPGYADRSSLLIKTAKKFNSIQRLYRMNTTFIEIIPSIKEGQDLHLHPLFGKTLIETLVANSGLSANEQLLRGYLITALVNISMAISMEKGIVKLTPLGAMVIGHDADTSSQIETPAMPEQVAIPYKAFMKTGKRYLDIAYKHAVDTSIITAETYTAKRFWA
jgi:hypothetical protein